MNIEVYSDIACPWCYIGKRRLDRALASFSREPVEVVFRSFQLDPSAPRPGLPLRKYLAGRYGARASQMIDHVVEVGRREGLQLDFDAAVAANTFDAHRLLWLVEHQSGPDAQRRLADALFEAHFRAGSDISDRRALAVIGASAGLDVPEVERYLASAQGTREVETQLASAHQAGIQAVPTFVIDGQYAVQGAQPEQLLLRAMETVAEDRTTTGAADGR